MDDQNLKNLKSALEALHLLYLKILKILSEITQPLKIYYENDSLISEHTTLTILIKTLYFIIIYCTLNIQIYVNILTRNIEIVKHKDGLRRTLSWRINRETINFLHLQYT